MKNDVKLAVVIPAYNEEETISDCINKLSNSLNSIS